MKGHKAAIHSLSFSAESSVLVSGSADSTVRVWDAKSAGGERGSSSARANGSGVTGADNDGPGGGSRMGNERGGLPMGPGDWDSATYVASLLQSFERDFECSDKTDWTDPISWPRSRRSVRRYSRRITRLGISAWLRVFSYRLVMLNRERRRRLAWCGSCIYLQLCFIWIGITRLHWLPIHRSGLRT